MFHQHFVFIFSPIKIISLYMLFGLLFKFSSVLETSLYAGTTVPIETDSEVVLNKYRDYLSSLNAVEFKYITSSSAPEVATVKYKDTCFWTLITQNENSKLNNQLASTEIAIVDFRGTIFRKDSRPPQNGEIIITSVLNPDEDSYTIEKIFDFPFIFGYYSVDNVNDVRYVPDLFQSSVVEIEVVGEKQLIILRKSEGDLSLSLWIDPECSYAAKKIKVERQNKELHAGKTFRRELEITDFLQTSNVHFPKKFHEEKQMVGMTYEPKDGKPVEKLYLTEGRRKYVEISDVQFNRHMNKNNFHLSSPIPNGTPVHMQDALQIEYVWMDGKPVVKTDEVALRIARGDHGFMPGPKNPRFWFMALGAILLLVGGGLKIRSMLKEG